MADEKDPRSLFAPEPTERQKALWDLFVAEYVKDWIGVQAAMRVGFNLTYAKEFAPIFLSEPYVQRKIMEFKTTPLEDEAGRRERMRAEIEAKLRANMNCGDPKVEVAAATKLGEMNGLMDSPDRSGEELNTLVDAFQKIAKVLPD